MIKALGRSSLLLAAIVALSTLAGAGSAAQAAGAAVCAQKWDCHGPLPFICLRCSSGWFECAHWACVHHRCVVETCPKK